MFLYEKVHKGEEGISVIGLGYVGIQTAVAFSKLTKVTGFDLDEKKIQLYNRGIDPTGEVGDDVIKRTTIEFTSDQSKLYNSKVHIVAVPTPVKDDKTPDSSLVESASRILGRNLQKGSIVIFESTVYPGMTEEVCIPILENESALKCGVDFFVGYSPERINPGDKINRFENIKKIVSAIDERSLEEIAGLYEGVITAGVHRASSIKVAEAAKVIENAQRDINIGFMNEISMILNELEIDTKSVLEAAETKWNFLKFYPGIVGGQCIGVDPYYLIHKGKKHGIECKIMSSAREINDGMGKYIGEKIVLSLIKAKKTPKTVKVAVLGLTFKENCRDIRNSKVFDIVGALREYGIQPLIYDPLASMEEIEAVYGLKPCKKEDICSLDAVVFAVAHKEFLCYTKEYIDSLYSKESKVLIDVKGIFNRDEFEKSGYIYWRL